MSTLFSKPRTRSAGSCLERVRVSNEKWVEVKFIHTALLLEMITVDIELA